jgi:hypothetical protein
VTGAACKNTRACAREKEKKRFKGLVVVVIPTLYRKGKKSLYFIYLCRIVPARAGARWCARDYVYNIKYVLCIIVDNPVENLWKTCGKLVDNS